MWTVKGDNLMRMLSYMMGDADICSNRNLYEIQRLNEWFNLSDRIV